MAKGRFRRKRRQRRKRTVMSKVAKLVDRKIAKNTELKFIDLSSAAQTVSDAGLITDLTQIGQGDHDDQRTGDKVTLKSLDLRMNFVAGDATNVMRLIIFRWKQYSGSVAPTQAQLMEYGTAVGIIAPLSTYHHDFRGAFQVLHDKTIYLNAVSKPQVGHRVFLDLKKLPKINFVSTGTTGQNKIYMYLVSDSAAATHPNINIIVRTNFVDS